MNTKEKLEVMQEVDAANRAHMEAWKRNQPEMIKGVLFDVAKGTVEVKEIEKSRESFYKVINCRLIDIAFRTIGGKEFDIICDDEALLTRNPTPSAVNANKQIVLFGNLFVVRTNERGDDVTSLSDAEIEHVMRNQAQFYVPAAEFGKYRPISMLINVGA